MKIYIIIKLNYIKFIQLVCCSLSRSDKVDEEITPTMAMKQLGSSVDNKEIDNKDDDVIVERSPGDGSCSDSYENEKKDCSVKYQEEKVTIDRYETLFCDKVSGFE